ncbi:hypothetical protein E4U55_004387 [Claviceps digitariae]|nr:hypothetical protein E4U55_004387 [Claviceps digitariae]
MPATEQQMAREPAPMAAAAPQSRASAEQPRPAEAMSAEPMRLRGGGEGEAVCCGVFAGLCCFECCECCCC